MVCQLKEMTAGLEYGLPVSFRRLRLTPLRFSKASKVAYQIFGEAGSTGSVCVEELSAAGSVPQLKAWNRSENRLFIAEGSTLIGAKQNRVLNISVLLAPLSQTVLPVNCVERRRWHMTTPAFDLGAFSDCQLRAKMSAGVTASLKARGRVSMDQAAVWSHVDSMLAKAEATSPTQAYQAAFEKCQNELKEYEKHFSLPAETCGVVVEVDETVQAIDLFDKAETLGTLWPRLIKSYALAALHPQPAQGHKFGVKDFLGRALAAPADSFQSAGIGTSLRVASEDVVGSALIYDDQLVHLSLFATEPNKASPACPPNLGQQPEGSTTQEWPQRPVRPWWRLGL